MKKRILTILMAFIMTMSFVPMLVGVGVAYAGTNGHSQAEAVAWANSQIGVSYGQCVNFVRAYYEYLGQKGPTGSANQYNNGGQYTPDGWYYQSSPQPGDIAVWTGGTDGHVAVVIEVRGSNMVCAESNYLYNAKVTSNVHSIDAQTYIHPDFFGSVVGIQDTVYSIHSALNNNLVLDVADGKTVNGTNIQTQTFHDGPAQRFNIIYKGDYYCIKAQCSNLVIDTEGNSGVSGANIHTWSENGAYGQRWEFIDAGDGYYFIRSKNGMYLDVTDGINAPQVNIQSCSFNGSKAQKWKLVEETRAVSEGYYSIHSTANSDLVLDIKNESRSNGGNLQLNTYNGCRGQVFYLKKEDDNYLFRALCSGKFIDTNANSDVSGANLQQWVDDTHAAGQRFKFIVTGKENHYIRSDLGRFIDITDGVISSGTNIQSCVFNGSNAQSWKLVKEDISRFKPEMPTVTITGSNGDAKISWNSVDTAYKNKYDVRIYDLEKGTDNYIKVVWGVDATSYNTNLPAGSYGVTVAAVDKIDSNIYSNAKLIRFKVDENGKVEQETNQNEPEYPESPTEPENPTNPENPVITPGTSATNGSPVGKGATAAEAEKAIMSAATDEGPKGTKFGSLKLKSSKQTKSSVSIKWSNVKGATNYVIYGNKCGTTNRMKKLAASSGSTKTFKTILNNKIRKGTYYKFIVVALDKNNKVVTTSKVIHVATKGGKVGNHKSVNVSKSVIKKAKSLKKGKTLKLKAKATKASSLKVRNHRSIAYESSNKNIASVSKKGVVKAKKKGTCYIYAYAQDGIYKKIKVVVK